MTIEEAKQIQWERFANGELSVDNYIKNINFIYKRAKRNKENTINRA